MVYASEALVGQVPEIGIGKDAPYVVYVPRYDGLDSTPSKKVIAEAAWLHSM